MSRYRPHNFEIPEETIRVAQEAFPKGNAYITMRDMLSPLFNDADFAPLFDWRGQEGVSPALLAMVTIMQYMEGLTDRQAADAVRSRIDWKYALGLPLTHPGFHYSILSPSAIVCWKEVKKSCCSIKFSIDSRNVDWSKGKGNNAPIPPTCWPLCAI